MTALDKGVGLPCITSAGQDQTVFRFISRVNELKYNLVLKHKSSVRRGGSSPPRMHIVVGA